MEQFPFFVLSEDNSICLTFFCFFSDLFVQNDAVFAIFITIFKNFCRIIKKKSVNVMVILTKCYNFALENKQSVFYI